jgi:hypothetical protein
MYSSSTYQIITISLEVNMTDEKVVKSDKGIQQSRIADSVKSSLSTAKNKTAGIRKTDSQLFMATVISPAAATLVAALAATIGGNAMFAQAATRTEDGGWQLACILAAILSFIGTVSSMFKKQFGERLIQGNQCVGRLLNLDLAITTDSSSFEQAAKEYGDIVKTFPEFVS